MLTLRKYPIFMKVIKGRLLSGTSGKSLSWCLQHEATKSISTPPPLDGWLVRPSIKFAGSLLHTWVKRGNVGVKALVQEHNAVPCKGSNPDHLIQNPAQRLTIRPLYLSGTKKRGLSPGEGGGVVLPYYMKFPRHVNFANFAI